MMIPFKNKKSLVFLTAAIAVIAIVPLLTNDSYYQHVHTMSIIFVTLHVSLDLLIGVAGILSLGHTAFFGVGAYTAALATIYLEAGFWTDLLLSGVVASVLALLLGFAILNVRGHRFVISTIAFSELCRLVAYNWTSVTGGQIGLSIPKALVFSAPWGSVSLTSATATYYVIGGFALVSTLVIQRVAGSRVGLGMKALRENDRLADALGVNTRGTATIAFATSAFFAGIAGAPRCASS